MRALSIRGREEGKAGPVVPSVPLVVTVASGRLTDVVVSGPAGPVSGSLSVDGRTWTSEQGVLDYGTKYSVSAHAVDRTGLPTEVRQTLKTVSPTTFLGVAVSPGQGAVVGVGMPIQVNLDRKLTTDEQNALKSPIEYLKLATKREGIKVGASGERAMLGAKESGIVGLTNKASQFSKSRTVVGGELAPRLGVDHTECPQRMSRRGHERNTGVEPDETLLDDRIVVKPGIQRRILDHHDPVLVDGMGTE